MYFDVLTWLVIALGALGICIALFNLYNNSVHRFIIKIFTDDDYEDKLTDEEKYKLYIEKKQKEIIKHQMLHQYIAQDHLQEYKNQVKIVSIMEPIGQWTRLVMSEKLQRFAGLKFDENQTGFWQMFVSMKSLSQGKHKGRSK
ncbi:putative membrane protein [Ehrlichia ruminantium]|uniref:Uncharacterized protein n=2 Tax=Ehrlichia ruminantium TaxID=779 RepID=A0A0H3M8Q8_EHRRW|nr:hypothetical protein [Ehrlichia ruminantium]QLK52497.1 hypothetical protein FDZ65_03210 [Ehrlichia ruminantium]QLK54327.1 hypothetical protein FDZ63_03210 [Ehrlichia ruminantium]QLK55249.1 hypothetical protein FDZ62_03215 [Ehrlichia ruminantium]QLK56165.1 hypothetical protein FDZ61_03205 [Ehrlichia ruminantium]QLK57080.1 hypothetical protein FDZ60_03220 [Ehrlichia ruminantium]